MTCFHPLKGWRAKTRNTSGKRSIVFTRQAGFADMPVSVPCGQCVGCRLDRSRQWAIRCSHEASLYDDNCFITLTFNDDHLPPDRSLDVKTFQKFMKRLRKRFGANIRFYHCGEYGEKYGRPHYHACLFNFDFPDKKLWKVVNGNKLYTSQILSELWPFGYSTIGSVTFESAAYVARYIMKKVNGDLAENHYRFIDNETGEIFNRKPEYTTMSRRPGIGGAWFDKFKTDVYPHDYVVINQKKVRPPRYYDGLYEADHPDRFSRVLSARKAKAKLYLDNNTPERLYVREQVQIVRLERLYRNKAE